MTFQWSDCTLDNPGGLWFASYGYTNERKAIEYIEKYGVNTKDSTGQGIESIFSYMYLRFLSIVFIIYKYEISLINNEYLYFHDSPTEMAFDVLNLFLRHDHDFKYLKYPIQTRNWGTMTLHQWFKKRCLKCTKPKAMRRGDLRYEMRDRYLQHYRKGATLFQMMLDHVDFSSNKKKRFH